MQLSVARYQAIAVGRGANLDTIDVPLNNRLWLKAQFAALRKLAGRGGPAAGTRRDRELDRPRPGRASTTIWGILRASRTLASGACGLRLPARAASSWWTHAEGPIDAPLTMRYDDLDPSAQYKLRVVYAGDSPAVKIRLTANGVEVHPLMTKPNPVRPVEFDLPQQSGKLELTWTREQGLGGNGRGNQVSEVWLIRK